MAGDVKKWGGASSSSAAAAPSYAGKSRQNSQRRMSRQFWPGMSSMSSMKRDTQTSAQGSQDSAAAAGTTALENAMNFA